MDMPAPYVPRRAAASEFVPIRGLRYHVMRWPGDGGPPLVLMHGWMDVAASFQFVVDELAALGFTRPVVAADWRGFGRSEGPPVDSYWFPDYVGDLDALLDHVSPDAPVDLAGHSMGGNIVMTYAGVRPERVRRLVNLEGFGLPDLPPDQAPARLRRWLDELKQPVTLPHFASLDAVAARLLKNHPRLAPAHAAWLAPHWAEERDGRWHVRGDPAHRRVNPVPYRAQEAIETWQRITAPLLWAEGALTDMSAWWEGRYTRADFEARLARVPQVQRHVLPDCGHMLHLDWPSALAACLQAFLREP